MSPSSAIVVFLLIFGVGKSVGFDPCESHTSIDNPYRSVAYSIGSRDAALCDSNLQAGWYKFINEVGGRIPETKPDPYHCGTVAPIWIGKGTHPGATNQVVEVEVCANMFDRENGCALKRPIKIKNCGNDTYVYKLVPFYGCSMAYCAGDKKPCPKGQIGTLPNCKNQVYANVSENLVPKPRVIVRQDSDSFSMICKFDSDRTKTWTNLSYAVEWFADNHLVKKETVCSRIDYDYPKCRNRTSDLHQNHTQAGQWIHCSMRMRYTTHINNPFTQWKSSNPYYVGLELSEKHLTLVECDRKYIVINIRPTVPILPSEELTFVVYPSNWKTISINESCYYRLTKDNFKYGKNVTVKCRNVQDVSNYDVPVKFHLQQENPLQHKFWSSSYKKTFTITFKIKAPKNCRTHNDPHVDLFDRREKKDLRNTIGVPGTYVLYKNKKKDIEIQTRHWQCAANKQSAACNCGVAIKEKEDIIVFTICNEDKGIMEKKLSLLNINLNSCCKLSKAITIKEKFKGESILYKVILESGTMLKIKREKIRLDIDLYAPIGKDVVEGLCGNANGDLTDDFNIGRDGINYHGNKTEFTKSWKLDENSIENLFKPKKNQRCNRTFTEIWCRCKTNDCSENVYNNSIDLDSMKPFSHKLVENSYCKHARKRRSVDAIHDIYYSDDIILDNEHASFFVNDKAEEGEKTTSFKNKRVKRSANVDVMSKENATWHCKQVLQESAAAKMCKKFIQYDIDSIMSSCISDLKITGDLQFARGAFGVMQQSCETTVFGNISLYKNSSDGELVPPFNLVSDLCPNDCSDHGSCTNRTCICDKGYTSMDCSSEINAIPKLMGIYNGGLCDVRQRPCKKTDLLGKDFIRSENLTCHVLEHKVFPSRWQPNPQWLKLSGDMFDLFGVRCDLPDPPTNLTNFASEGTPASGLWISISNDKERKSQKQMRFISYDSVCMSCNRTGNCTKKENTCLINGHCFSPNQWNPRDWCQLCIPVNSPYTWTKRKDNKAPSFEAGQERQYAIAGEQLPLQLKASDPDYRPVKFSMISSTVSTGYTLSSNGLLQWNVTSQAEFTVKVTDECNATDTITITLNLVKCLCKNGGRCYPHPYYPRGSGQYSCQCPTGFNGTKCETNINDCPSVNCGNGTCIDGVNNYTCRCHAGFMGSMCNQRIYKCTNETCFRGVACNETVSGIICGSCPDGLLGDGKTCLETTPTEETTQYEVTESPTTEEMAVEYTVELRVLKEWDEAYLNKASQQFKILAATLENEIVELYRTDENYMLRKIKVISVRKGSIIIELELAFFGKPNEPLQLLKEDVKDGVLGPYKVDPKYFKVKGERTDQPNASEKPTDLFLILLLAGLAILVIIVVIAVILVRKYFRVNYQFKDTKEAIEMEQQSATPISEKAFDIKTGHVNTSYQ